MQERKLEIENRRRVGYRKRSERSGARWLGSTGQLARAMVRRICGWHNLRKRLGWKTSAFGRYYDRIAELGGLTPPYATSYVLETGIEVFRDAWERT